MARIFKIYIFIFGLDSIKLINVETIKSWTRIKLIKGRTKRECQKQITSRRCLLWALLHNSIRNLDSKCPSMPIGASHRAHSFIRHHHFQKPALVQPHLVQSFISLIDSNKTSYKSNSQCLQ